MLCPNCKNVTLIMSVRNNIEIDYCSSCRGVWLDKGELDKLIELSIQSAPAKRVQEFQINQNPSYENHQARGSNSQNTRHYQDQNSSFNHEYQDKHHPKHKKKESWLGEIFDFD